MSLPTIPEQLGIVAGSRIWVIGDTVEETSLLDPLPDDVEIFHSEDFRDNGNDEFQDQTWGAMFPERTVEPERPHGIDTAVIIASFPQEFHRELDEALPRMGSVSRAWIVFTPRTLDAEIVERGIADYGWSAEETFLITETWQALRIKP